jgi:hypothetical protein
MTVVKDVRVKVSGANHCAAISSSPMAIQTERYRDEITMEVKKRDWVYFFIVSSKSPEV